MVKPRASRTPKQAAAYADANGYWAGAHTMHRLRFHLVWTPKYRRSVLQEPVAGRLSVLQEPVASRLSVLLCQACEVREWQLHELNIQPDHVHMLLQISSGDSVADVMNLLKGGTSRLLRREFPELAEFLWGDSLWGDGYFAETVGQQEEGIVRAYIRDQNRPRPARPARKKPGTFRV